MNKIKKYFSVRIAGYRLVPALLLLICSCKTTKEITITSKYKQTCSIQKRLRTIRTKSIVLDTIAKHIVLFEKERRNAGSYSYTTKLRRIYYDNSGKRIKKYVSRKGRSRKKQRHRTVLYLKNHYGNTLADLEALDQILNDETKSEK